MLYVQAHTVQESDSNSIIRLGLELSLVWWKVDLVKGKLGNRIPIFVRPDQEVLRIQNRCIRSRCGRSQ